MFVTAGIRNSTIISLLKGCKCLPTAWFLHHHFVCDENERRYRRKRIQCVQLQHEFTTLWRKESALTNIFPHLYIRLTTLNRSPALGIRSHSNSTWKIG